ncbi:MAG: TonB-dependent receptor [bacterium]
MSGKWIFLVKQGLSKVRVKIKTLSIIMMLLLASSLINSVTIAATDGSGKIVGTVTDKTTGEPLLGVTVSISGTSLGGITDLDGYYRIKNVPVGVYELVASCVGYDKAEMGGVVVKTSDVTTVDLSISEQLVEMEGITVKSKAIHNTEVSILAKRQKAAAISDAISSEQISRSGSGNSAEAMTKVTGASVLSGKYVYIRGLGDRYTNTQLNGSPLPSPDPDKQAVPLDLIPTGLLDNIVVEKSFTADKPGNFAGGSVNLNTRDYPEKRQLKFSTSASYNSLSTGKDVLSQPKSGTDWLGYDNGKRQVPAIIQDSAALVAPPPGRTTTEQLDSVMQLVEFWDRAYDSFDPVMTPRVRTAAPNQSHSLSYGDLLNLFNKPLGVVASLSYSQNNKYYENGFYGRYEVEGEAGVQEDPWIRTYAATDSKGTEEVLWGGMTMFKYGLHPNHKFGFSYAYTRNGISSSRQLSGPSSNEYASYDGSILRNYALIYTERKLWSSQLSGEHVFGAMGLPFKNIRANWQVSHSKTSQNDPDTRYLTDEKTIDEINGNDTVYQYLIEINRVAEPVRLWRDLDEENRDYKLDFELPFSKGKIKTGTAYLKKERTYRDFEFHYGNTTRYVDYNGDIDSWASDLGFDSMYTLPNGSIRLSYSNALSKLELAKNQYDGSQEIFALYGMFDYVLSTKWSIIGGLRYETTKMYGATHDLVATEPGDIDGSDLLPSVNLIYHQNENMNLRLAYGRTLARPTIREMIPAPSEEFGLSRYFFGNSKIDYTRINNLETRWEWFMRPGEVASVSVFYKYMKNPIEMVIVSNKGEVIPQNTDKATIYGVEFEFRRRLDHTGVGFLQNFTIGGNLTLVKSEVTIPEFELEKARLYDDNPATTRQLHGQSPYIINLDLGYNSFRSGTNVSLFYNVSGRRLTFNASGATPDVYEVPQHNLDFQFVQKLFLGVSLKIGVKNILDEDVKMVHDKLGLPNEEEKVYLQYKTGRTYSIGMSYDVI